MLIVASECPTLALPEHPLAELFGGADGSEAYLPFWEVRRHRRPLLAVPPSPVQAARTLDLYPAQTWMARWGRRLLRHWVERGFPPSRRRMAIPRGRCDPFWQFLEQCGADVAGPAPCGVFFGNGSAAARRCLLLLFDARGAVAAVVKAGAGSIAKTWIRKERGFLQRMADRAVGVPRVIASFTSDRLEAFAMEHLTGSSPVRASAADLLHALRPWILPDSIRLSDLPSFHQLSGLPDLPRSWPAIGARLGERVVRPVLQHGDFAPWNIKVDPATKRWQCLDWERSEPIGVPCWDWFHYVVQTERLVQRRSVAGVARRLEALQHDPSFRTYAGEADALPITRELCLGYLLYSAHVISSDGIDSDRLQLFQRLAAAWIPDSTSDTLRRRILIRS